VQDGRKDHDACDMKLAIGDGNDTEQELPIESTGKHHHVETQTRGVIDNAKSWLLAATR
jgi:hypothetical protein